MEKDFSDKIFVGGAPRSGTTMLAALLGSHSQVLVTSETQFKFDLAPYFDTEPASAEEIFERLQVNKRFRTLDLKVSKEQLDYTGYNSFISSLVTQYSHQLNKSGFLHWADVTPVNLRHAAFLDRHFPVCLFIHLIRDGRAVFASQQKVDFGSNDPVFAALKWIESVCLGLAVETKFGQRCLRVHYENLVENPDAECRRICDFLKMPFEETMLDGHGFRKTPYTSETHTLVGQRPDPTRIETWKQDLSEKEILYFESMTYDLLDLLGYERMNKGILKKPHEIRQIQTMFFGALKYLTTDKWKNQKRFKKYTGNN